MQITQTSIKKLETQVGQLGSAFNERENGQFPSQVVFNPKDTQEPTKSIIRLCSGRVIGGTINEPVHVDGSKAIKDENKSKSIEEGIIATPKETGQTQAATFRGSPSLVMNSSSSSNSSVKAYVPHIPYQGCLKASKYSKHMLDIFEQFKMVEINIPLLDAIKKIPSYAKFLKDHCTNKRKFEEHEKVMLFEQVSAAIQRKLPPKLRDPVSFTIACTIGKQKFERALLDLGALMNLMPQ